MPFQDLSRFGQCLLVSGRNKPSVAGYCVFEGDGLDLSYHIPQQLFLDVS